MNHKLTLGLYKECYGVCRLMPSESEGIPVWAFSSNFFSITKTSDELSIVCLQDNIPEDICCERDWRILKIEGTLDFSLIGILSSISTILAHNKISIFAVSTYDTDYILVKDSDINNAVIALKAEGYQINK